MAHRAALPVAGESANAFGHIGAPLGRGDTSDSVAVGTWLAVLSGGCGPEIVRHVLQKNRKEEIRRCLEHCKEMLFEPPPQYESADNTIKSLKGLNTSNGTMILRFICPMVSPVLDDKTISQKAGYTFSVDGYTLFSIHASQVARVLEEKQIPNPMRPSETVFAGSSESVLVRSSGVP